MLIQKKMTTAVIILTGLCLLAPTAEAKADDTTGDITYADRNYYTVVIPAEVIVKDTERSENLTLSVTTRQNCNVEIKVESDNDYKLYNGNYSVSYAIPDKDKELVFSNENSEDKKQDYSIDISVTGQPTVSGEYTDMLKFIMTGKEYPAGTHQLIFDMNCDQEVYTEQKFLKENDAYGVLPTPEIDGYEFDGWYTAASGGEKVSTDTLMGSTDTTVYAHWTPHVLTINYHNGGAEYIEWDGNNIPVTGEDITKFQNEKYGSKFSNGINGLYDAWRWHKTGYTAEGKLWLTNKNDIVDAGDDHNLVYAQDCAKNLNVLDEFKKGDVTVDLYPIWKANVYYINYDKNADDATGNTAASRHTYDEEKALTPNSFYRSGYEFLGWSRSADASTPTYTDQETVINLSDKASITLYAVWKAETETVQYDSNCDNASGSMKPTVHTYGIEQNLSLNAFTREGYTFTSWNEESDGSGASYEDGESITELTTEDGGTLILYAQWEKEEETVEPEDKEVLTAASGNAEDKNTVNTETADTEEDDTNESDKTEVDASSNGGLQQKDDADAADRDEADSSDAGTSEDDKSRDNADTSGTGKTSEDADIPDKDMQDDVKKNDSADIKESDKTAEDTSGEENDKVTEESESKESETVSDESECETDKLSVESEEESKDTAEARKFAAVQVTTALTKSEYDFETE